MLFTIYKSAHCLDINQEDTHIKPHTLKQSSLNQQWCAGSSTPEIYNCPQTNICTSNYLYCPYISALCPSSIPFKCDNGLCTKNLTSDCCLAGTYWCPHTNKCVSKQTDCCTINQLTPIYCNATSTCVSQEYQCCSNFKSYVTSNKLVKCSFENKCVPQNTADYCFQPFDSGCSGDLSYQCPQDGKCVKDSTLCASQKVCPTGYYMCPDYTCLPGLGQFPLCNKLPTCTTQTNQRPRCSDGVTCIDDIQMCPTQVTCAIGLVLCPDNTCVSNQQQCLQAPSGTLPKLGSCGPGSIRCPNGECNTNCNSQIATDCQSLQMVQCPGTFQCVYSYEACPTPIYCPIVSNYTYSLKSIICEQGPQICTWDQSRCKKTSCQSQVNYFTLSNITKPWTNYNSSLLKTCSDGRCSMYGCMSQVSCSSSYPIKSQIVGYYCTNQTSDADKIAEVAYKLQAFTCPYNMITCLSGHCRANVYDCPQYITCPVENPIQCQDGSCVSYKDNCTIIDILATKQLKSCIDQGLIMCQSDFKTCAISIEKCPTLSTCPFGYSKCSENYCVLNQQCNYTVQTCNQYNPIYCRSTDSCVASLLNCPSMTICPSNTPVKCASDQSCQTSISLCPPITIKLTEVPTQIVTYPVQILTCSSSLYFKCKNGACNQQCEEWQQCLNQNEVQCNNGRCVADVSLCPIDSNGCPFYLPVFCKYQAKCVTDISQCTSELKALYNLNNTCRIKFGQNFIGCPLGNCVNTTNTTISKACLNFTTFNSSCAFYQYPNDNPNPLKCYVYQCPQNLPYKCANGLCVLNQTYCPVMQYSAAQINLCVNLSLSSGFNLSYPCGDGSCASNASQCPPLYSCQYNQNDLTIRCNDGTCRSDQSQCPQSISQSCTFRCQSGQCVQNQSECFTENGCKLSAPFRCQYNSVCMQNSSQCYNTTNLFAKIPIKYTYKPDTICESKGLVTCISNSITYCAQSISKCFSIDSGCPVQAPILCGGNCVQSILNCTAISTPSINNQGCPTAKPFRCSSLDINSCQQLPYSQNPINFDQTCSAQTQSIIGIYPINKCSSSITPYSCADGSCVSEIGQCQSCPTFCSYIMSCTATQDECNQYTILKSQNNLSAYLQLCPPGVPIRCAVNGLCVSSSYQCTPQISTTYNQIYTNQLDANCPSDQPIRCINGTCTNSVLTCFNNYLLNQTSMINPIKWGVYGNTSCSVYCSDGSCRDSQQNCPLAQSCLSPEKPYRCMNGFCAQDYQTCVSLFGALENDNRYGISSFCIKSFGINQNLAKCEDGTCRPTIYNQTTKTYTTSCLQYFGCPIQAPYQCPTGHCVNDKPQCLLYSNNLICSSGQFMCKNMACVTDPLLCNIDLTSIQVLQLEVQMNPQENQNVVFAYNQTQSIGIIDIPSGSLSFQQQVLVAQDAIIKVRINPVPDQRSYIVPIQQNAINYTSQRYPVTNNSISSLNSLLGPMLNIDIPGQLQLLQYANISYKIDLPSAMDLKSDICLGQVQSDNQTLSCISRNITYNQGWVSFPFIGLSNPIGVIFCPEMSLKTVVAPVTPTPIIKPDPTNSQPVPVIPTDKCTKKSQIWCNYQWWIIGAIGGFVLLIIIITLIICYCRGSTNKQSEAEQIYNTKPIQTFHNENMLTESEVEERVQREKEIALRLIQQDFKEQLREKDLKIQELEVSLKENYSTISRSSIQKRPEFNEELRLAQEKIKMHYASEVQRIAANLQKEAEESGLTPPRNFIRPKKSLNLRSYSSDDESRLNEQSKIPSDQLSQQWNKLVHEYRPPKELLSVSSRPLLQSVSDIKSAKSNIDKRTSTQDNDYKPKKYKNFQDLGPNSQSAGVKKGSL